MDISFLLGKTEGLILMILSFYSLKVAWGRWLEFEENDDGWVHYKFLRIVGASIFAMLLGVMQLMNGESILLSLFK